MTLSLAFAVVGPPQPKQRARVVRSKKTGKVHAFTPHRTRKFEQAVKDAAREAIAGMTWPLDGRYRVEAFVYFGDARRRDIDNAIKSVADACNRVLWNDDSQIATLTVHRAIDRQSPRTEVHVEVLP